MRGPHQAALIFGLVFASPALAGQSLAETPRPKLVEGDVSLAYVRAPKSAACPDEAAFRERAADAFEFRDPFVPAGADASAHMRIEITRTDDGFLGTVFAVDAAGQGLATSTERHVDCDALVWVLSHRMALAIFHAPAAPPAPIPAAPGSAAVSAAPGSAAVSAAPGSAAVSAAPASAPIPPEREPESAVAARFMAGGMFTAGLTRDAGWGIWLGGGARVRWLTFALETRAVFPQTTFHVAAGSGTVAMMSGLFVPCLRWRLLSVCFITELGAYLFANPAGARDHMEPLVSFGPRMAIDQPLGLGINIYAFAELDIHPDPPFPLAPGELAGAGIQRAPLLASGTFGAAIGWSR